MVRLGAGTQPESTVTGPLWRCQFRHEWNGHIVQLSLCDINWYFVIFEEAGLSEGRFAKLFICLKFHFDAMWDAAALYTSNKYHTNISKHFFRNNFCPRQFWKHWFNIDGHLFPICWQNKCPTRVWKFYSLLGIILMFLKALNQQPPINLLLDVDNVIMTHHHLNLD